MWQGLCKCCRVGHIVWKGNIRSLSIKGTGVSKVYVQGSLGAVAVQLTGVSEAHLGSTSGQVCRMPTLSNDLYMTVYAQMLKVYAVLSIRKRLFPVQTAHLQTMLAVPHAHDAHTAGIASCFYFEAASEQLRPVFADDMVINGNVDMLSKVLYSGGRCEIGQVCMHKPLQLQLLACGFVWLLLCLLCVRLLSMASVECYDSVHGSMTQCTVTLGD